MFYLKKCFLFLILLFFVACGNPPEPYNANLANKYTDISNYEKNELLDNLITQYVFLSKYKSHNDGCIYCNNAWYLTYGGFKYINHFKECFVVEKNNILRISRSRCSNNFGKSFSNVNCSYIDDSSQKYSSFINNIQNQLLSNFEKELNLYTIYKKECLNLQKEREKVENKLNISIIDKTRLLPRKILDKFFVSKEVPNTSCLKLYLNNLYSNKLKRIAFKNLLNKHYEMLKKIINNKSLFYKDFLICTFVKPGFYRTKIIGRYRVVFNKNKFCKPFNDKDLENMKFYVTKVYFNFVPEEFNVQDHYIAVKVKNNNTNEIFIKNNSNQIITINSISMYYGNKVLNIFLSKKPISISPQTEIKLSSSNYEIKKFPNYNEKFVLLKNKTQKEKYGLAIGYKVYNENILKTLFKIKEYSINDFLYLK